MEFKVIIMGDSWKVRILPTDEYTKEHGHDSIGMCVSDKKTLDFMEKHLDLALALHEVTHAFESYQCLSDVPSQETSTHLFDEYKATFIEKYWSKIGRVSTNIVIKSKKLEGKKLETLQVLSQLLGKV